MSAIWGVIHYEGKDRQTDLQNLFQNAYEEKCKVDAYSHFSDANIYVGCGIQKIRTYQANFPIGRISPIVDSENGLIFVTDCLLDNREDIYLLLSQNATGSCSNASYPISSHQTDLAKLTDDELMYLAYLRFGDDCFSYFTGLYSIAVWNANTKCLTLVTDSVCSRSLYYARLGKSFGFSTLITPLIQYREVVCGQKAVLNESYFKDFLLADSSLIYVVPGETSYQDIYQIPPATILKFQNDTIHQTTYEHIDQVSSDFLDLYKKCVSDAIQSTGNVGIALSSGLDSSSIAVLAAKDLAKSGKYLYSYTFMPHIHSEKRNTNDSNAIFDESDLIRELCQLYPSIKPSFLTNDGKNCFQDVARCKSILEMPYKSGALPNHLEICAKACTDGCRILLNGAFGNSTVSFGELPHVLYDLYLNKDLENLVSYLKNYCAWQGTDFQKAFRDCLALFSNYTVSTFDRNKFVPQNPFLQPNILNDYALEERMQADPRTLGRQFIDHSYYPVYLHSPALLMYLGAYETKFGLSHNLILRDPTKDIRLIQFCEQLPFSRFAQNGETRWLIRHTFRNLLPSSFLSNRQQHAYLNADWLDRVERDWEKIRPLLEAAFSKESLPPYLATEQLQYYVSHMDFHKKEYRSVFKYVVAIYNILYQL